MYPQASYPQQATVVVEQPARHAGRQGHHANDNWGLKNCDEQDRLGFIRKVYSILFVQLAITFGAVFWVVSMVKDNCFYCPFTYSLAPSCTPVEAGPSCNVVGGTPGWMVG